MRSIWGNMPYVQCKLTSASPAHRLHANDGIPMSDSIHMQHHWSTLYFILRRFWEFRCLFLFLESPVHKRKYTVTIRSFKSRRGTTWMSVSVVSPANPIRNLSHMRSDSYWIAWLLLYNVGNMGVSSPCPTQARAWHKRGSRFPRMPCCCSWRNTGICRYM